MTIKVLIVDDSPIMRAFMKRVFALAGLETAVLLEAGDGQEALGVLRCDSVDLILSDVNMPVMNGEEFLRALKADQALRSIPFIVVSTDARLDRVDQMMTLGANGYITKPFAVERLRAEIERVLEVSNA
jgi:two-component system chemotaxis response regulator CheY